MSQFDVLRHDFRQAAGLDRRAFLLTAATLATLPASRSRVVAAATARRSFAADPFTLGVASGDPAARSVVLWTRLAPEPLAPGGGMPAEIVPVAWEVADDEGFQKVVRQGVAQATAQLGHSVHVEVDGLEPDRWYWYRFRAGDATTPVGRARTLPTPGSLPDRLRFAFASCQHYESGLYTAYQHMAQDELDLVVHLGDYIYENAGQDKGIRKHHGPEIETLEDYRARHAQYRSDPLLQAMHAQCPWLVTWDDHEVDNNYADAISEKKDVTPAQLLERRANAYQAYYEMMPLRTRSVPRGPEMRLYRRAAFGRLADLLVLDTRQYRSDQPNSDRASELNDAAIDPQNTLLGDRQKGWLKASLLQSTATWNVLAQQVMMAMVDRAPGDLTRYSMDQWPGYTSERMELVRFLAERRVANPVVLTGDIHSNWVNDLRIDDRQAEQPVVATEFVGTSISSGGNGRAESPKQAELLAENPCVRFHNAQRGYVRCTVTPQAWRSDYVVVEDVTSPGAPAVLRSSFVVEAGRPGAQRG